MTDHDAFFNDEMLDVISQVNADLLPLGEYLIKINSITPEVVEVNQMDIRKYIIVRGQYVDDGLPINIRFSLNTKTGRPNPVSLRELGQSLISSGLKKGLPEICKMKQDELPVVVLTVFE